MTSVGEDMANNRVISTRNRDDSSSNTNFFQLIVKSKL